MTMRLVCARGGNCDIGCVMRNIICFDLAVKMRQQNQFVATSHTQ